jgi:hypothetical protein
MSKHSHIAAGAKRRSAQIKAIVARSVRVADLPDLLSKPQPHPSLHCDVCYSDFSAHNGDYWQLPPAHVFTCCGQAMRLVRRETRLITVLP